MADQPEFWDADGRVSSSFAVGSPPLTLVEAASGGVALENPKRRGLVGQRCIQELTAQPLALMTTGDVQGAKLGGRQGWSTTARTRGCQAHHDLTDEGQDRGIGVPHQAVMPSLSPVLTRHLIQKVPWNQVGIRLLPAT